MALTKAVHPKQVCFKFNVCNWSTRNVSWRGSKNDSAYSTDIQVCLSHRCSVRLVLASDNDGADSAAVGGSSSGAAGGRLQQLNRSLSFSCCCCCCFGGGCLGGGPVQNLRFLRHRSFNDFQDVRLRLRFFAPSFFS